MNAPRHQGGPIRPPEVRAAVKTAAAHKKLYGPLTREQEDKMIRA